MGERELGLEVELNVNLLIAVLRLPPAVETVALLAPHDILDQVTVGIGEFVVGLARVTDKALLGVWRCAENAVALGLGLAAC